MQNSKIGVRSRMLAAVNSFIAMATGLFSYVACADPWVWTGAQDAYWTNAANWTMNGAVATTPPGRFMCDGVDSGAFDSSVEFGDVASGGATTIDLDGFRDVSNLVVSAAATRYQFGTSDAQSLTIHSTAGVFRVQGGALAPVMTAQFGAWRYGAKPSAGLNDAGTAKIVNDSEETLEFLKMFYIEDAARSGEKPIRFEGSGDIKISGLSQYKGLIYLDLAQTDGAKLIWNCRADNGDWRSAFRKIRNAAGIVSEIELLDGSFLSGYAGMGPFEVSGTLTLSGPGEYQCNVGKKAAAKATDGNLYLDQQNIVRGTMYVRCLVTSYERGGYQGGWTIYGGSGITCFDGDISNEMLGDAKILPEGGSSGLDVRPTFSVGEIGAAGQKSPLGMAGVIVSGGGRLLYTGAGETCTKPFSITNRVPRLQNAVPIDMNPCAVIEQGGTGKLTFDSPIVSYGLCLDETTVMDATLELANSTSQEAEIGTVLSDNLDQGKLNLIKKGSGMWRLAKANEYTGSTTILAGALVVGAESAISDSSSLVMQGGDLVLESDSGAARSVSVPAISISSGVNRIMVADGVSVTAAGLSVNSGTLDVQISGSGSFAVTGLSGVPSSVTIGGRPAEIGADGKFVVRGYDADVEIAARGGRIPASGGTVGITSSGGEGDGPVALADGASSATIGTLVQKTSTPATVALSAGQTLSAAVVAVEAGRAALTVGSAAGTGTVASTGDIEFDNMSGNPLTVLASLSVPPSSTIFSIGYGLTRLWWPADWAGMLKVSNGTLALTNDSDIAFTSTLSGTGEFRKEGSGTWTMAKPQDTTFSGDFTIAGGEVSFSNDRVFGSKTEGRVTVADGATLKPTTYELSMPPSKKLHLAGRGPSGEGGALDLGAGIFYAPDVELDGDTRIAATSLNGATAHLLLSERKISGKLDMNGHSLNIATNVGLNLYSVKVTDPGPFVFDPWDVEGNKWCVIYLYNDCDLGGEEDPYIEATVGSRVHLDEFLTPVHRKFRVTIPTDSKYAEASFTGGLNGRADGVNTNFAQWAGPVEIVNAGTILSFNPWDADNADRYITVSGKISGAGDVCLGYGTKSGTKGHVLFMNPENTYAGSTVLSANAGSSLTLFRLGSLPDWSKLTVHGPGRIGVVAGDGFFSAEDIIMAANSSANWSVSSDGGCKYLPSTLAVNTSYLADQRFSFGLSDDDITRDDGAFSIGHDGKGELELTGSWTKPVRFSCFDGVLKYTGAGIKTLGAGLITGNGKLSAGEVLIEDAEDVRFTQNESVVLGGYGHVIGAEGRLTIRDSRVTRLPVGGMWNDVTTYDSTVVGDNGDGVVAIEGSSVVTNRHVIGRDLDGRGAVYLRGGRLVEYCPDSTAPCQRSTIGYQGYGYLEVGDGAFCDIHGMQYMGMDVGGQGVFVQKGGVVVHSVPWETGRNNNWSLANSANSVAMVLIEDGIHTNAADTAFSSGTDSRAYFTVEGGEYINHRPANPNRASGDSLTIINLNGGVFSAWNVAKTHKSYTGDAVARGYVNFNGGTFLGLERSYSIFGIPGGDDWIAAVDRVTVYEGGAVIDSADGITLSVDVAMSAPTGNGVASVSWSDTGVKYVGSPIVEIIGDGTGASAFAEFDSVNRKVTGIKVTSAGCDYTWAKAVIRYGNEAVVTNAAVTLAPQTSGSLTKKGPGMLCLNVANSYGGDTVVEGGTLVVNADGAIPEGSKIVLKGGMIVAGDGVSLPASVFRFDVLEPATYPGEFGFPEGSSIEIANLDKLDKAVGSYALATFDGGLSGYVPEVSNKDDLPPRWYLMKSGKSIKVRYSRGSVVSFR